ncbi:hypothetical protein CsSME_00041445 [Camellia sinensis var. sinensis]
MEEFSFRGSHVPAFGSWDCNNDDLPFTQCFESARQPGLHRYSYSEDRDLYVSGDLYQNDVVTPAMIVVPRRRVSAKTHGKEAKRKGWEVGDMKEPASHVSPPPPPPPRNAPRAVDEDLYQISPDLLYAKLKRKRGRGLFSSCLLPTCIP